MPVYIYISSAFQIGGHLQYFRINASNSPIYLPSKATASMPGSFRVGRLAQGHIHLARSKGTDTATFRRPTLHSEPLSTMCVSTEYRPSRTSRKMHEVKLIHASWSVRRVLRMCTVGVGICVQCAHAAET